MPWYDAADYISDDRLPEDDLHGSPRGGSRQPSTPSHTPNSLSVPGSPRCDGGNGDGDCEPKDFNCIHFPAIRNRSKSPGGRGLCSSSPSVKRPNSLMPTTASRSWYHHFGDDNGDDDDGDDGDDCDINNRCEDYWSAGPTHRGLQLHRESHHLLLRGLRLQGQSHHHVSSWWLDSTSDLKKRLSL